MPEKRHEIEAKRILIEMGADMPGRRIPVQSRQLLAEALEKAERRGRQISGREKESSG